MNQFSTKVVPKIAGICTLAFLWSVGLSLHANAESADSINNDTVVFGIDNDAPPISIAADNLAISEALKDICKKSRWGLVLDAPEELLSQKVTVLLPQKKSPAKVLELVLAQKGLVARLDDGVLRVNALPKVTQPSVSTPPEEQPVASPPQTKRSESREFVIRDFSQLKQFKKDFKKKLQDHQQKARSAKKQGPQRVEFGGPVTIKAGEEVSQAVSFGEKVTVSGNVREDAVSMGGNVLINKGATVGGDAVSMGGNILVKSGATVDGDVVSMGGKVTIEDGATVGGDRVSFAIPMPAIGGIAGLLGMGAMFWVLAAIFKSVVILAVALIIVWVAPQRVAIARDYLVQRTGRSLLSGLLILLGLVPLIVLLAVTIIGIPLIPFVILLLIAVVVFGLAALISWLGYRIPLFKDKKSPAGAIVLGFFAFLLINMIPIVGGIFLLIASLAAAGATFLSRFGKSSRAI